MNNLKINLKDQGVIGFIRENFVFIAPPINTYKSTLDEEQEKLPGSSEPQDLGSTSVNVVSADEEQKIKELSEYANRKEEIYIDLNEEKIVYGNNELKFEIDPFKKKCLLEGLDDIALSLKKSEKIEKFENNLKNEKPWVFND